MCIRDSHDPVQREEIRRLLQSFLDHADLEEEIAIGLSDAELTEELDESNFIDGYHLDVDKLLSNEI